MVGRLVVVMVVVCAMSAGCGSSSGASSSGPASGSGVVGSIPNMGIGSPATGSAGTFEGFYDAHLDTYLTTDASTAMLAGQLGTGVNTATVLSGTKGAATPREFYIQGRRASHQPVVFGSEPGESDYSPLWLVVIVRWKPGVTPVMLVRDDQIDSLAKAGKLTETTTKWVINSPITKVTTSTTPPTTANGALFGQGQPVSASVPELRAFYDGHKDTYLLTDVSDKAQASQLAMLHINAAPVLRSVPAVAAPNIYFVRGKAATSQIPVLGSEPGESSYSPLWTEVIVHWKANAHPILLVRDDQIDALAKKGDLTETSTKVIVNAPVTHVG
jgi:hypothetical protein